MAGEDKNGMGGISPGIPAGTTTIGVGSGGTISMPGGQSPSPGVDWGQLGTIALTGLTSGIPGLVNLGLQGGLGSIGSITGLLGNLFKGNDIPGDGKEPTFPDEAPPPDPAAPWLLGNMPSGAFSGGSIGGPGTGGILNIPGPIGGIAGGPMGTPGGGTGSGANVPPGASQGLLWHNTPIAGYFLDQASRQRAVGTQRKT